MLVHCFLHQNQYLSGCNLKLDLRSNNKSCLFCPGNDLLIRCTEGTDPKIAIDLIFKNTLCFICLDNSHITSKGTSNCSCIKWEDRHNISICTKDFNPVQDRPFWGHIYLK